MNEDSSEVKEQNEIKKRNRRYKKAKEGLIKGKSRMKGKKTV